MLDSLNRFITKALDVAYDVGKKAGKVAVEYGGEALRDYSFINKLLAMPHEQALEELRTKMEGTDEVAYTVLKLTLIGMMRMMQAAQARSDISPVQRMALPKVIQTLTMYANYVDELHDGKPSESAPKGALPVGSETPSQTGKPELTKTLVDSLAGTTSQTNGRRPPKDASSPEQIIADFISRKRA